ncbi:MAG: glycosyltransferase family 4 protein [Muribaculaceae bacterium]|nr:glycosyltransferase family 4 protein [Muribaculaceae bacterium]
MGKKYTVGTCGYYGDENTIQNGQTIKTVNVTFAIKEYFGQDKVRIVDYTQVRKRPFSVLCGFVSLFIQCKNIVLFPDQNAYKAIIPLAVVLSSISRNRVFYLVVGGWLPDDLKANRWLLPFVKKNDFIFAETTQLKNKLKELSINNVEILTNFRIVEIDEKRYNSRNFTPPYKICFISRVTAKKGVTELVNVINEINSNKILFELDIYGGIDSEYLEEFHSLGIERNEYINYKGELEAAKVIDIMSNYYLHVLPTKFKTEGFPGSIIEGFYGGVPTLASRWNSAEDIISDNIDGLVFEFDNFEDMKQKLIYCYNNPDEIIKMREQCRQKAKKFSYKEVIKTLTDKMQK